MNAGLRGVHLGLLRIWNALLRLAYDMRSGARPKMTLSYSLFVSYGSPFAVSKSENSSRAESERRKYGLYAHVQGRLTKGRCCVSIHQYKNKKEEEKLRHFL